MLRELIKINEIEKASTIGSKKSTSPADVIGMDSERLSVAPSIDDDRADLTIRIHFRHDEECAINVYSSLQPLSCPSSVIHKWITFARVEHVGTTLRRTLRHWLSFR